MENKRTSAHKHPRDRGNGSKLSRLRIEAGLTQQQLAQTIGVTQVTLSRWEVGIQAPTGRSLIKLASVLGCHAEDLLEEER